jgi:hypothetical protein
MKRQEHIWKTLRENKKIGNIFKFYFLDIWQIKLNVFEIHIVDIIYKYCITIVTVKLLNRAIITDAIY